MVAPKQGDIILMNLNPTRGSEQAGSRPALVVSQTFHNKKQKMIYLCPITSSDRKYPTHIPIGTRANNTTGFVMCEQLKSLDYFSRGYRLVDRADNELLSEVLEIIDLIIWGDN